MAAHRRTRTAVRDPLSDALRRSRNGRPFLDRRKASDSGSRTAVRVRRCAAISRSGSSPLQPSPVAGAAAYYKVIVVWHVILGCLPMATAGLYGTALD